jgi:hypothetical protein
MSTTDPGRTRAAVRQYAPDDPAGDDLRLDGWVTFAGVMLAMLAALNLIDGIAAVSDSTFFVNEAKFIFSNLNTWGWILIVTGVVQGLTAVGVVLRTPGIRWIGVAIAALNAIVQMFFISAYPFWSLALFTLDILVIYGLVAHGARSSRSV